MPVMSSDERGGEDVMDEAGSAITIKHESGGGMSSGVIQSVGNGGDGGIVMSDHHPPTLCGGCGFKITDRFYLVAVERAWHSECLRCGECRRPLDTALSCFARQSRIYCRDDYYRLFGVRRCNRCCLPLGSNELVMRARDAVFHLVCFTCAACNQPLTKGDIFGMRDGIVYCRLHYEMLHHAPHHPSPVVPPPPPPPHHHLMTLGGNNNNDMPCDLSCTGPHGLLHHPNSNFHPDSLSPAGSAIHHHHSSPHMINLLPGEPPHHHSMTESPLYSAGLRPFEYLGTSPSSGFFNNNGSNGGPLSTGSHHHHHHVQKGRPRKRKMTAAAAASAAAVPSSNANHSGDVHPAGSVTSVGSPPSHLGLRQLGSELDLLGGGGGDLSSMEGMVYDSSGNGSGSRGGDGGGGSQQQQQQSQRTKRMRTSFKHHQLRTMKSYFAINQNPDAKDLKQLAQKTGLSKRVLQVWFQNARAKWRRNIMRHQDGGGGVGGAGGSTSSIKDGDGLLTGPSSSSSQQHQHGGHQHHQHDQSHHQHHSQQLLQQLPSAQQHRVSASLGELTPPGSAGGMNSSNTQHSSAVSNEDTSSNLVFSDLY